MKAEDRAALIALYLGTGGDAWFRNTGWCTDAPISHWHGVSVDDQGRVVRLQLIQNNLVGGIPRELGSLHNPQELDLSGNTLTGGIPKELGSLHNLKELDLSRNMLKGGIPRELGSLQNLQELDLSGNFFTGGIPRELGFLHNLQELDPSRNELTGGIPRKMGSLHKLQKLDLWGNGLTGGIPRELGSLHNLQKLFLWGNKLTGRIPRELGSLHDLQELDLSRNKLSGRIPRELGSLHNLQTLYFWGNNLTGISHKIGLNKLTNKGAIPAELGALEMLEDCILFSNQLSGEIPKELGSLHNLRKLVLSGNKLSGGIPRELGSLRNLQKLLLWGNMLTGTIPVELGGLKMLEECVLHSNQLIGGIPRELGSLHNLQKLVLSRNEITGGIPRELGSLHNLLALGLSKNKLTGALPAQLVKLYSLRHLDLDGNNFGGPLPSLEQLEDLFDALARADSGKEARARPWLEPTSKVLATTEGHIQKGSKATDSMNAVITPVTATTTAASVPEPSVFSKVSDRPRRFGHILRASEGVITKETVSKVAARVSGFEGNVMVWSFGATTGVTCCPDFELEIPNQGREVPALIGQSPSKAEIVDGEFCLLHSVATCLARSGEVFNPPLLLRFPVGDVESIESGSDVGSSDEGEESYCAYLRSIYSAVMREEGSATWVPIVGEILKMDSGMFVMEAQVSHFTDYALKQPVKAGQGQAKIVEIKRLPHERRRNVFSFVNQGDEVIVVFCWRRPNKRFWISRVMASVGFSSVEVSGEVDREILDSPNNGVYSKVVYPSGELEDLKISDATSLEAAWTTLEEHGDHRLVNVWGKTTLDHKTAMVIGPLQERVHARILDLRIAIGEDVGTKVRTALES